MFFLGPSVHIFVYLLVSAFFFICFYIKDEAIVREEFPENRVICVSQVSKEQLSVCRMVDFLQEKITNKQPEFQEIFPEKKNISYHVRYKDPFLAGKALRAPPVI